MAQAEDTELRDLVLEALEKNGSLAKIRALLRANIFLAFEDDSENMKQNVNLDNILKIPEGVLALSIVHEFLEFCNLKNTLFVYMSESRQGTEYMYEGRNVLVDRLHFLNGNQDSKEPVLVTFVKNILRPHQRNYYEQGDAAGIVGQHDSLSAKHRKDDQNCTYIVHEDSSMSTSNSTSDNSSDEKNKLHLKLPLDNSDTDTSSDSVREKMSSEYIPNEHILSQARSNVDRFALDQFSTTYSQQKDNVGKSQHNESLNTNVQNQEIKPNNNSSESTSYVDIKSFKPPDQPNTMAIAFDNDTESNPTNPTNKPTHTSSQPENIKASSESISSATMNSISSLSLKQENGKTMNKSNLQTTNDLAKSDNEATEYSLDFSLSPVSRNKSIPESQLQLPDQPGNTSIKEQSSPLLSPHQNSQSSQSSVSISDVADLIEYSDRSYLFEHNQNKEKESEVSPSQASSKSKNAASAHNFVPSEDSGDFSESPIPSLSNLSLDVHSD